MSCAFRDWLADSQARCVIVDETLNLRAGGGVWKARHSPDGEEDCDANIRCHCCVSGVNRYVGAGASKPPADSESRVGVITVHIIRKPDNSIEKCAAMAVFPRVEVGANDLLEWSRECF